MIEILWVIFAVVFALSIYVNLRPAQYMPDHVFLEKNGYIYVGHTPLSRLLESSRKKVELHSISKIQLADNIITLFNTSGNAIDIHVPRGKYVKPIFSKAKVLFKEAEVVEVGS